jgi:hypothetical protein
VVNQFLTTSKQDFLHQILLDKILTTLTKPPAILENQDSSSQANTDQTRGSQRVKEEILSI